MVLSQAIGSIVALGLEGEHMCYIIARVRNNSTVGFFIILIREFYLFVFGNISVYSIGMLMTTYFFSCAYNRRVEFEHYWRSVCAVMVYNK